MPRNSRRFAWVRSLVAGVALMLIALPASAALDSYMTMSGSIQGPIPGDVTAAGHVGQIEIDEMHHLFRDEAGATIHEALIVTTPMGVATPSMLKAMSTHETLAVSIDFLRPSSSGASEVYYQMVLDGARVVAVEPIMPDSKNPSLVAYPTRTRVRLSYTAIQHISPISGTGVTLVP